MKILCIIYKTLLNFTKLIDQLECICVYNYGNIEVELEI